MGLATEVGQQLEKLKFLTPEVGGLFFSGGPGHGEFRGLGWCKLGLCMIQLGPRKSLIHISICKYLIIYLCFEVNSHFWGLFSYFEVQYIFYVLYLVLPFVWKVI